MSLIEMQNCFLWEISIPRMPHIIPEGDISKHMDIQGFHRQKNRTTELGILYFYCYYNSINTMLPLYYIYYSSFYCHQH